MKPFGPISPARAFWISLGLGIALVGLIVVAGCAQTTTWRVGPLDNRVDHLVTVHIVDDRAVVVAACGEFPVGRLTAGCSREHTSTLKGEPVQTYVVWLWSGVVETPGLVHEMCHALTQAQGISVWDDPCHAHGWRTNAAEGMRK